MGLSISLHTLFVIQYHRKHSAATLKIPRLHSAEKVSLFFSGEGCLNVSPCTCRVLPYLPTPHDVLRNKSPIHLSDVSLEFIPFSEVFDEK